MHSHIVAFSKQLLFRHMDILSDQLINICSEMALELNLYELLSEMYDDMRIAFS